jgi:regulator of sigma E protease
VPATAREAVVEAVTAPPLVVKTALTGLADWATGHSDGELSGFVGMVRETAKVARRGWFDLFELLATLSAYLGAFNLLPIPALDGARLMFLGYEATTRRRANARIEAQIHAVGLVMMLGLMAYVTVNDIRRGDRSAPVPSAAPSASPSAGSSASGASSAAPSSGK